MFLLVLAYPGCPGSKAVKRSLLLSLVSCFSKIQMGFTFLVPAHPGSPRQRAVKGVCVIIFVNKFAMHVVASNTYY